MLRRLWLCLCLATLVSVPASATFQHPAALNHDGQPRPGEAHVRLQAARGGLAGWRASGLRGFRGVTVGPIESSQHRGKGYGSSESAELLDELQRLGVNWIAVTPYGRMWSQHSVDIKLDFEAPYAQSRAGLRRFIRQAHRRGMQVFMVPHLWIEREGWHFAVGPKSESRWRAFLASYREFVLRWATDAALSGTEMFAIGQEWVTFSSRYPEYWRGLIREVRSIYPGLLTYSANWWDEVFQIPFWEDLDLVSVSAYYPLGWDRVSDEEVRVKADEARRSLATLSRVLDMPIFFSEFGYSSRKGSLLKPSQWPENTQSPIFDEAEQLRGYRGMLEPLLAEPWFIGLFLWRYYADIDDVSQEPAWAFSPHAKLTEQYLKRAFHRRWAADPWPWPW